VDYRLALVSFLPLLILIFIGFYLMGGDKNKAIMEKYHKSLEDMNAGIVEFVHAMPVMKIFNQSASSFKKFSDTVNSYEKFISDWTKRSAPLWGVIMSFLANSLLPALAFGLYLYFDKSIELSTFFLFLILGVGYVKPIFALASLSNEIVVINYGVKRIDEILFSIKEQTSGDEKFPDNYSIEFKNLNFSYKKDIHVLKNINMNIKQGSITALVGPSGSGKSTLAKLIARFYELNAGSIKIGETNINEIKTSDLMDNIGFVFQDAMMFHQSISDNIKMGADKSREEVVKAAKMACCHDFIMNLPDGYDTHLGDKGIHLSGGEKQRIQLARVALKDAKILILDEATAFSDPENEANIMKAFSKVIKDKTVVVIAHRLSTIAEVDQIVVLDKGEIESFGRHEELLAESSLYLKMWNAHNRVKEFEIFSNRSTV